ncbi:MurR/RpiR family transcriptional regulator [Culicoidibacter larvae]|uniref:MurR/RpiR family transcriptional regulator n=1 Tax=Culicoidibacter larvae TaxID=2579976 RepID=A0A5R8QCE3_9FIRM|nr:MurR/RpiR family transcriptional regulator [Culicoidibacter larvae]TLG74195.1 MurR/RpiR family transcriptional regulator [Culicoidibacter larvae]
MKFQEQLYNAELTDSEIRIADFIISNPAKLESLTIQVLARSTYTSNASIIRFANKLGWRGFSEMKIDLIKAREVQKYTLAEINPNVPFEDNASIDQIAQDIMHLMQRAVVESNQFIDEAAIFQATKLLYDAERIFIFASGDSQVRAESFQNKLWKINKYPIIANERGETSVNGANLTPKDCAFFISYTTKSANSNRIARRLRASGVPTILLTARAESNLGKNADVILQVPQMEVSELMKIATFASQTAFDYVLNVLFSTLYQIDYQKNNARQHILDREQR